MNRDWFPFSRRPRGAALSVLLLLFLLPSQGTAAPGPPNKPTPGPSKPGNCNRQVDKPATVYIGDVDSNGLPVTFASDGLGPYYHNVHGVQSIIRGDGASGQCNADWFLILHSSPNRTFNEALRAEDAAPPGDPHFTVPPSPPFWGSQFVAGQLKIKCSNVNKNMSTMTAGSTITCPLLNNWLDDLTGQQWSLNPASITGYPEVTDVQIRCNTVGSDGRCNDWFIDPIDLGEAVARLTEGAPNQILGTNHGDFYMRFHVRVTRP